MNTFEDFRKSGENEKEIKTLDKNISSRNYENLKLQHDIIAFEKNIYPLLILS